MSVTLVIESTFTGHLAVAVGLNVLWQQSEEGPGEVVMPGLLHRLIRSEPTLWSGIERLLVNTGPGSYTALRAGVTLARTLAQRRSLPSASVNSLQIAKSLAAQQDLVDVWIEASRRSVWRLASNFRAPESLETIDEPDRPWGLISSPRFAEQWKLGVEDRLWVTPEMLIDVALQTSVTWSAPADLTSLVPEYMRPAVTS